MKIYVVDDKVQDSLDSGNFDTDSLYFSNIKTDTIICPINQSIPESKFGDISCDVATSTRKAYAIGVTEGDFCFTYNGKDYNEFRKKVLAYCIEHNPDLRNKHRGLIYDDGGIAVVYAPIKDGMEFCFYRGENFNCNYEEFNTLLNVNRADCKIDLEELVGYLSSELYAEVSTELPTERKKIKNRRGVIKSCSGGSIYDLKKKTYRIRCPMVLDDGIYKPQTSLLGFGGLNNTVIGDGFYEGDLTIGYVDGELKETLKFLEEKGGVEWLDGQQ